MSDAARITALRLRNFRGVRELSLSVDGQNVVVVGPNGSGKSSVADAIDFLLTGRIRRLTGGGAGRLSVAKHAPYLGSNGTEAYVEGDFRIGKSLGAIRLRRDVGNPDFLRAQQPLPDEVQGLLDLAGRGGLHMLTRRDILRYINTEPSTRGEQVGALLDLTAIDVLRKEIEGAAKDAKAALDALNVVCSERKSAVYRCLGPGVLDKDIAVARVNATRARLGASPVTALSGTTVREGLAPPANTSIHPLQSGPLLGELARLRRWFDGEWAATSDAILEYVSHARVLHSDPAALEVLRAHDLLIRARPLAVRPHCPLCLTPWTVADLQELIDSRTAAARTADSQRGHLAALHDAAHRDLTLVVGAATRLIAGCAPDTSLDIEALTHWVQSALHIGNVLLCDPIDGSVPKAAEVAELLSRLADDSARDTIHALQVHADARPALSDTQSAWDQLTTVAAAVGELEREEARVAAATAVATELAGIASAFLRARDETLQSTYDDIADRFSAMYRQVHGENEAAFAAKLSPTRAGLDLSVDFHGRGLYPPNALHSEGHQDSMGLCLFLALAEHFAGGSPPLLVLDDVLMSIDTGHRRGIASLLQTEFGPTQLIITTHDEVWWRQLSSLGVVPRKHAHQFRPWTVEDGARLTLSAGVLLSDARLALASGNVSGAAHALRRAVETYMLDVCDGLGADVRCRADGRHMAGDFIGPALGRYKELLKRGRAAALSWGDDTIDWDALDARRKTIAHQFDLETWAVNANVHFNDWANFVATDFAPVIDAYDSLFGLFACPRCDALLVISESGADPTDVHCSCGALRWNLIKKT